MHTYLIKYDCIFILTFLKTVIKQKNKYACIYYENAQNYTKYVQNSAFTNGTPYKTPELEICKSCLPFKQFLSLETNKKRKSNSNHVFGQSKAYDWRNKFLSVGKVVL